jgi:hypothetical protein
MKGAYTIRKSNRGRMRRSQSTVGGAHCIPKASYDGQTVQSAALWIALLGSHRGGVVQEAERRACPFKGLARLFANLARFVRIARYAVQPIRQAALAGLDSVPKITKTKKVNEKAIVLNSLFTTVGKSLPRGNR